MDQELDIINLLKTVHKLKAGLSAVIKDDEGLISSCQKIYLNSTTINAGRDRDDSYKMNEFEKFLEITNRQKLIDLDLKKSLLLSMKTRFISNLEAPPTLGSKP